MNMRTYGVPNVSVWTVRRSAAQVRGRWFRRKVRQVWLGGRAGPRRRYRWTEALLTAIPSLSSDDRLGRDQDEGLAPVAPDEASHEPEEPVAGA
jgi:hypothetical protein